MGEQEMNPENTFFQTNTTELEPSYQQFETVSKDLSSRGTE
jgi:hypothetical protein